MRVLRIVLLALLLSLLIGLAIGTVIRLRLEKPVRYIGWVPSSQPASAAAASPLHVADARAGVLEAGEHEEQVG